jgi:hypothetical protein
MRLKTMLAPDTLHRGDADTNSFGHRGRRPVRHLAGRGLQRLGNDMGHDRFVQRRDACGARLIAQQPLNAVRHEPLLPTPDAGLGHARLAHDRRGADARGRQKDNPAAPDMLLWAVSIRDDRLKASPIRHVQFNNDPCAHPTDSHNRKPRGIDHRTLPSDFVH